MQVWCLDANPDGTRVVAGFAEPQLELFEVVGGDNGPSTSGREVLHSLGSLTRQATDRAAGLQFSGHGTLLACLGAGKAVELFRSASARDMGPQCYSQQACNRLAKALCSICPPGPRALDGDLTLVLTAGLDAHAGPVMAGCGVRRKQSSTSSDGGNGRGRR